MRSKRTLLIVFAFLLLPSVTGLTQSTEHPSPPGKNIKITLLGTAAGPPVRVTRYQMSTLVEAGGERLLFDCGRGTTLRLAQAGVPMDGVTKLFITHLHSDHIVDIPDLYLSGWAARSQRKNPLEVWGPAGTHEMMEYLQKAFAFDIHIRRDVDEHFAGEGIKQVSRDIEQGVIYENNGVKVTAFVVDHGPVKPAFGYRVDYAGHSVAISGDTRPSENLVRYSKGVDVLIHEAMDPQVLRSHPGNLKPAQVEAIIAHHTTPEQAGEIFTRVKPRLAIYSHYPEGADLLTLTRKTYSGPLQVGEDLMTIDIGEKVDVGWTAPPQASAVRQEHPASASDPRSKADAPELSPQQRPDAIEIIADARERVKVLSDRLTAAGKLFDDVLLGEDADIDADGKAADAIKAVLNETAETRLQAARKLVHLLTREQRLYLKAEMAKPGAERGILEAAEKVFHLSAAK
jgi:ribonuclease Z